jgi:hypothetical protein
LLAFFLNQVAHYYQEAGYLAFVSSRNQTLIGGCLWKRNLFERMREDKKKKCLVESRLQTELISWLSF